MKKLFFAALLCVSTSVNASVVKLGTNFGMMTEFDEPQLMQEGPYPNGINNSVNYRASCSRSYISGCSDIEARYFGFRFALTDTFIWNDGGYIDGYDNALKGDFYINAFIGGKKFSYLVEDTGERWLFGSFYTEIPSEMPISSVNFSLASAEGDPESYGGTFVFDKNRTGFYLSDKPVRFVPETSTVALFLMTAIGLGWRRRLQR